MKRLLLLGLIVGAALAYQRYEAAPAAHADVAQTAPADNGALEAAIDRQAQDVQVSGSGTVIKVLPDDNDGSRHQRFILELESGRTLLIAHNIDLAPRLEPLRRGDLVSFHGEYVWNNKGGVVHWTHHDPRGRHPDGRLRKGAQQVQ